MKKKMVILVTFLLLRLDLIIMCVDQELAAGSNGRARSFQLIEMLNVGYSHKVTNLYLFPEGCVGRQTDCAIGRWL
jgi:hypothetical protein